MATVGYKRILDGTEISGKYGESLQITEKWAVRVDSPLTSKVEILNILSTGGVYWGSDHWEFPACKAMEFSCSPSGKDGMLWIVTVRFYIPPPGKKLKENGIPEDYWEAVGGITSVPAFVDVNGEMIVNSAKDPLEGIERERGERSWVLTKFYEDDAWMEDRDTYSGTVNYDTWDGGAPKTWKVDFKSATIRKASRFDGEDDGGEIEFIETRWEFRYDPDTWKCMPWDIGFMQLVGGQREAIKDSEGRTVKQPVALNSDGSAKAPGEPPSVIKDGDGVDLYGETHFTNTWGAPSLIPTGS